MKGELTLAALALAACSFAQTRTIVYCFPGQGSDERLFDSLKIDPAFEIQVLEYGTPAKHATMKSFARELATQIDTTRNFILLGVSLGGMLCAELSEILRPEKTILISSAKNRNELPVRYKFQRAIPIYKLVPGSVMLAGAKVLQPIVEPDRNKHKQTFKKMLGSKESTYMRRTVGLIINWDRVKNSVSLYHIHGSNDHTLPIRKVNSPTHIVDGGSHMMTLTRAADVSNYVNLILVSD